MALNPDRKELFASLVEMPGMGEPREEQSQALIRRVESMEKARDWLGVFEQFLPEAAAAALQEYLRFALLGLCLGFIERELSPYVAEHLAIVPPLLEDIRSVHEQIQSRGADVDAEEFRFRAFDYGVHKAYYLDWTLYMSREPY
ncbi:MAG: hypothetical protein O7A67_05145 [SAR324 cluster bacterium]|nr:hypothetical protein [SAR324 cluster bacterium]MCZ6747895.1 hypothetical protein [SAR324 cluster bacterium]